MNRTDFTAASASAASASTPTASASDKPISPYQLIISLHSYTSNYEGQKRAVEIGVLHSSASDPLAEAVQRHFHSAGYDARLNEPWSGRDGFMFAADSIAAPPHRHALMIEFRNDLLTQPKWRAGVILHLITALQQQTTIPHLALSVDSKSVQTLKRVASS